MKKRSYKSSYKSLSEFYADLKNHQGNPVWAKYENRSIPSFTGLQLSEIKESRFSYPVGIQRLRQMAEVKVEKPVKVKFYDQFDGHDIDIDRMFDNLDFLINERKIKKLPKAIDIYINIGENCHTTYTEMLHKTYAALRIIDHLESLGVRTAVYAACHVLKPNSRTNAYFDVCLKNYADTVNLGALCTAISPWMLRHWGFLWIIGNHKYTKNSLGGATKLPREELPKDCIVIETGFCLSQTTANNFIQSLKIA